jgi:hypothetical protein
MTEQELHSGSYDFLPEHQDDLLDQALEETFPASDPISPMCPLSVIATRVRLPLPGSRSVPRLAPMQ